MITTTTMLTMTMRIAAAEESNHEMLLIMQARGPLAYPSIRALTNTFNFAAVL